MTAVTATRWPEVRCRRGVVASPHVLASQAGLAAFERGGNAVDAALAAAITIAVVYPHMNGVGGDAFWLVFDGPRGELRRDRGYLRDLRPPRPRDPHARRRRRAHRARRRLGLVGGPPLQPGAARLAGDVEGAIRRRAPPRARRLSGLAGPAPGDGGDAGAVRRDRARRGAPHAVAAVSSRRAGRAPRPAGARRHAGGSRRRRRRGVLSRRAGASSGRGRRGGGQPVDGP